MDGSRFDVLSRAFADGYSRRRLARLVMAVVLARTMVPLPLRETAAKGKKHKKKHRASPLPPPPSPSPPSPPPSPPPPACPTGQKECQGTCVPESQCCTDSDCLAHPDLSARQVVCDRSRSGVPECWCEYAAAANCGTRCTSLCAFWAHCLDIDQIADGCDFCGCPVR